MLAGKSMKAVAWKVVLRWLWVLVIIVSIFYYAWPRREYFLQSLDTLGLILVGFSFLLIIAAKIGLVENMRCVYAKFGIHFGWLDCFYIYNFTQLAKYMPGSMWQFVSRFVILNSRGYKGGIIRDALIAEHLGVILVAVVLGIFLPFLGGDPYIVKVIQLCSVGFWCALLLVATSTMAVIARLKLIGYFRAMVLWFIRLLPPLRIVVVLVPIWMFFGASIWITFIPFVENLPPYFQVVGAYCLAYLAGFLVPFAPAGIGIREAVLFFWLSKWVDSDIALLLTAVNRFVYIAAEILLFAIGILCSWQKK
jgi:hypothetical protein